jgi:phthiocerol/phenolphthiocerol synthesis type-I polyketide synthase E
MGSTPATTASASDDIAIVGMSVRLPKAGNLDKFWANLRDGVECRTTFTDEDLLAAGVPPDLLEDPHLVRGRPILDGPDLFDAGFFGYSPREAELIDPQQRVFLECAWDAIESAGYDPYRYPGAIGVFAGGGPTAYLLVNIYPHHRYVRSVGMSAALLSNDKDFLATRVSYKLNLRGPSVNVVTGCSTSLVAVHQAVQSLLNAECDLALAGGVTIYIPQRMGYVYEEGSVNSPDGHCRSFDVHAGGTTPGDGAAAVLLKRLDEAVADGDAIHAVIKGSAINNDGSGKASFAAPSVKGQAAVIREALAVAGATPESIGYVEAHGTATKIGDVIELTALTEAFGTDRRGFCAIGSVKPNVGHTASAAGAVGLVKTALALEHEAIPPSINCARPNPQLGLAASPFYVNTELTGWKTGGQPRRAGVSSFGIGGTNAHAILEEAPALPGSGPSRPWKLLPLAARSPAALQAMKGQLARHLRDHPDLDLADAAYTLQVGRHPFNHRTAVVCRDADMAVASLDGTGGRHALTGRAAQREPAVIFLFPGQGSQYVGMGAELYRYEPAFREHVDACCDLLADDLGLDLRGVLYPGPDQRERAAALLDQTWLTQPALFVTEYALARVLMDWGVHPAAMCGHSIGEYVAACLAEVMSLADALHLVAARGRLSQQQRRGAMVAVFAPEAGVAGYLNEKVSLAAVNASDQVVLSGSAAAISGLIRRLDAAGLQHARLRTSHAFHSGLTEPAVGPLTDEIAARARRPPKIPYVSNVTGDWVSEEQVTDPGYWGRQLRETVRFAAAAEKICALPGALMVEAGPGDTLRGLVAAAGNGGGVTVLPALPRRTSADPADVTFLEAIGRLWLAGAGIDWAAFTGPGRRRRVRLPTYPFQRTRHWVDQPSGPLAALVADASTLPAPGPGLPGPAAPPPPPEALSAPDQAAPEAGGEDRPELASDYVAPRTEVERVLAGMWSQAIGINGIGVDDNFFDLGGHSLFAARLIAQVQQVFSVEVSIADLFTEALTVAGMARIIEQLSGPGAAAGRTAP